MSVKLVYQPERPFRLFDALSQPKQATPIVEGYEPTTAITFDEAIEPLKRHVAYLDEMIPLVEINRHRPHAPLSSDEFAAVLLFTMEWSPKEEAIYSILHRILDSDDDETIAPWRSYIDLLHTAVSKLPAASNSMLYRATCANVADDYPVGRAFVWNRFEMCSSSLQFLEHEALFSSHIEPRTIFCVHTHAGKSLAQHAFSQSNHQILLPRNQRLRVVSNQLSSGNRRVIVLRALSASEPVENTPTPVPVQPTPVVDVHESSEINALLAKRLCKCTRDGELALTGLHLIDADLRAVVTTAIERQQCTWLCLKHNHLTDGGLAFLADELAENDTLESLYLSRNSITGAKLHRLAPLLTNSYSALCFLDLSHNQIDDKGAEFIADILETGSNLTDLWLSYNRIGDRGMQLLVAALASNDATLIQLYLHGNTSITDVDTQSFRRMLSSSRCLNTLWLQNCGLSARKTKLLRMLATTREEFDLRVQLVESVCDERA